MTLAGGVAMLGMEDLSGSRTVLSQSLWSMTGRLSVLYRSTVPSSLCCAFATNLSIAPFTCVSHASQIEFRNGLITLTSKSEQSSSRASGVLMSILSASHVSIRAGSLAERGRATIVSTGGPSCSNPAWRLALPACRLFGSFSYTTSGCLL